jgi:hypothetical protein
VLDLALERKPVPLVDVPSAVVALPNEVVQQAAVATIKH